MNNEIARKIDQRRRVPKAHSLKCWPEFFAAIAANEKRHDLRRADDRDFEVGDVIVLCEYDPVKQEYTGRKQQVAITYITAADRPCALSERGLSSEFCILSIKILQD